MGFIVARRLRTATCFEMATGEEHHVEARLVPQLGADGTIVGCFSLAFDISDRIIAEDALRRSEERYRSLVEICPDAVYVHRNFRNCFRESGGR